MSRRKRWSAAIGSAGQTPAATRAVTQRFATKAWELWTGPRDAAAAVDTVRIVERTPRTAAIRPPKGIPRARGC